MDGKTISIGVVEWTSHHVTVQYAPHEHVIDADHSLRDAVVAVYPPFANDRHNVVRVVRGRGPLLLWHHDEDWFNRDTYSVLEDGDEVEIQILVCKLGPDTRGPGAAYELEDDYEERDPRPPAGAVASDARLVRGLLRRLRLAMPD